MKKLKKLNKTKKLKKSKQLDLGIKEVREFNKFMEKVKDDYELYKNRSIESSKKVIIK